MKTQPPRIWPLAHKWGLVDYWLETDKWPDFCKEKDLPFDCKKRALAVRTATARSGQDTP